MLTGEDILPQDVAAQLIRALDETDLSRKEEIMDRYRRRCITVGREISLVRGNEILHAKAVDIDPEGALIIQLSDGAKQTVTSGEVSIRGMYGYV